MKLKAILFTFLQIGCLQVFAQTAKLRVVIIDDRKDTVQNATAILYRLPDTTLITKKILLAETVFSLKLKTNYVLKTTATGMQDKWQVVIINADTLVQVEMRYKINNLGNVTVISKKPLVKQEDDKTVVDAEVLANSSTNAFEILEKTPGTIVDQDGNVYLSSTTPATIMINGREMKLSSADIASLLKSLPAGSVSKIEILRTPSAKYDAASSGGMVNIVLKKGVKLGTNGTFNIAYFQGVYGTKTAGFNLNKGSGKINSYISYQFTDRNNFEELNSDRFIRTDTSLLTQKSFTTYPTTNNYLNGGIDIEFTPRFNAGYDMRMSYTKSKSFASNNIVISKDPLSSFIGLNNSDIINANHTTFLGSTLSAKYKIDTTGSEWTTVLDYNYYGNTNTQLYNNFSYSPPMPTVSGDGVSKNNKHVFLFQTDLVLKLQGALTLEAGFKTTISNSENSADYFKDTGNNIRFVDGFQTNAFKYKENITAAYMQVSKTFAGFTIKPGLRLELTDINGKQLIPKDTTLSLNRADIFPYLFIKRKLFKMFGFPLIGNAIYRKSIRRPYYEVLNPYPKYVDQYVYDVGNPKLKPQFTTNYEVNVTFNNIPVIALGINNTKDIFSSVTYQDSNKIAYRTYDNLGKNRETYAKVIGGIPPGGRYFFYAGVQFNHNIYNGFYEGRPLNYKRSSWTFFMFQELKVTPAFSINMQGFMRTKGLQNLYELNTFGGIFISANKSIFKKKANIILSVSDLLQTNRVSFSLQQGSVSAQGQRINDTRRVGLTFRYNFGIKPKEENKKPFEAPADVN
ncbi:MAG: TonB-dependent receptor [Chitinophagaceae bacterium]|nr:TonB-dependent receptor [Chitinophagaceae bacterium]